LIYLLLAGWSGDEGCTVIFHGRVFCHNQITELDV
jgi:hypothetical protein